MDHELAKELKDAGFPGIAFVCKRDDHDCRADKPDCKLMSLHLPTLSELIEACGEYFCRFELQYWPNKHLDMNVWWATARDTKDNNYDIGGETPEEAVARL